MKSALFLVVGLLALPPVAQGQIEIGFDSGVMVQRSPGSDQTTFELPSSWLRFGFPSRTITFESLITFVAARASGQTATLIRILPGVVYQYRASTYVRGELGLLLISAGGESFSQFGYGLAVGTKRQIGPGPVYVRFEAGVDQWRENNDFLKSSDFRGLIGLSIVVN